MGFHACAHDTRLPLKIRRVAMNLGPDTRPVRRTAVSRLPPGAIQAGGLKPSVAALLLFMDVFREPFGLLTHFSADPLLLCPRRCLRRHLLRHRRGHWRRLLLVGRRAGGGHSSATITLLEWKDWSSTAARCGCCWVSRFHPCRQTGICRYRSSRSRERRHQTGLPEPVGLAGAYPLLSVSSSPQRDFAGHPDPDVSHAARAEGRTRLDGRSAGDLLAQLPRTSITAGGC